MSVRNLKHTLNGMATSVPLELAKSKLSAHEDGSTILISAMNGRELFVKKGGSVHVSTDAEWRKYWKKKK